MSVYTCLPIEVLQQSLYMFMPTCLSVYRGFAAPSVSVYTCLWRFYSTLCVSACLPVCLFVRLSSAFLFMPHKDTYTNTDLPRWLYSSFVQPTEFPYGWTSLAPFFSLFLTGLKFHLLNKEEYGFLIQPRPGMSTLHDTRMKFQHIKLEWLGMSKYS